MSIASPLMQPSPNGRRVGIRIVTFGACSGFTRVTARRIAQPPKVTFVARLRPSQLPSQAARQLPDLSTIIRVRSSLTDGSRLRGALPTPELMHRSADTCGGAASLHGWSATSGVFLGHHRGFSAYRRCLPPVTISACNGNAAKSPTRNVPCWWTEGWHWEASSGLEARLMNRKGRSGLAIAGNVAPLVALGLRRQ